ncbi:hypothetical protein [Sphingomonas abietis]|uniref:Glycosyltransferase RgtA/B/C/D-like domain-containing protein n=1 Tax=Sphingomonas abietis TaxID=3012344 RepID=A0ABY7NQF9_9SPHN|nr:hypothetical protein [Sphingomonas abietis]WBO23432.1 hypothetical protein PBT88_04695 [Sphingomonas abietis]
MARSKTSGAIAPPILVALLLAVACFGLFWPGVACFDATGQFAQAVTNHFDDWHPPIMAQLWSWFLRMGAWGTGPMLLVQLGLYWLGLGLLAVALHRAGAPKAGWAALLIGLLPPMIDWLVVIDKDAQLIGATVAATGLLARFRLTRRPTPWWAVVLIVVLLGYAVLLRANSVFAIAPLALAWAGWFGLKRWWARAVLLLAATGLVLGASGPINHGLLGADRSGVQYTLPLFDLAGIATRAPLDPMPGLSRQDWARAQRLHCYTPFFWDPFADYARCGPMADAMLADDNGPPPVYRHWVSAVVAHPLAYLEHRLAHLNATLRIRVPVDEHSNAAPAKTPPNLYNVGGGETMATDTMRAVTMAVDETPAGSPAVWLILAALLGWTLLGTPDQPARAFGLPLILSALLMTASFAVVSIASDLRYHLWLFTATALAAVLLGSCRGVPKGRLMVTLAVMAGVCLLSVVLRAGAPPLGY